MEIHNPAMFQTTKQLYCLLLFFIISITSISIIYTLLEFCYPHLKSHYYVGLPLSKDPNLDVLWPEKKPDKIHLRSPESMVFT